jgi:hypothetical protein
LTPRRQRPSETSSARKVSQLPRTDSTEARASLDEKRIDGLWRIEFFS